MTTQPDASATMGRHALTPSAVALPAARDAAVAPVRILSIIVPVFNEAHLVGQTLDLVLGVDLGDIAKEIIVVDDGSTDETPAVLGRYAGIAGVRIHRSAVNAGKGAAVRIGLSYVTGDAVIFQDADLEYDPKFYPALLRPMIDEGAKVVYGSRFKGRIVGMRSVNRLANLMLRIGANVLYGADITDEATGFKLLRTDVIRSMSISASGFDLCPEITARVRKAGYRIREVPIDYVARTHAEGKKIRWHDGFHALWTLLRYRFRD